MKRSIFSFFRALVPAMWVASPLVLADDTDIYYASFGGNSNPLVMLTLDLRSNLSSTQCTEVTADSCNDHLTDDLYYALDLISTSGTTHTYGPDGVIDSEAFLSSGTVDKTALRSAWAAAIASDSDADSKVRLFDVLRAAFQVVLNDDKLKNSGLWVGLMVMHEHSVKCAGPEAIPTTNDSEGCSNGAYVLKGFFQLSDTAERTDFFKRLAALPMPANANLPPSFGGKSTWEGHTYQLNELYLEYYRYITGQDMYNGLHGYSDYNSREPTKNLTQAGNDSPYLTDAANAYVAPDPITFDTVAAASPVNINYLSPFETMTIDDWACSGLYIINTVFGVAQQDADSDAMIKTDFPLGLDLSGNVTNELVIAQLLETDILSSDIGSGIPDVEGDQGVRSFFLADKTLKPQNDWAAAGGTDYALSLGDGAEIRASFDAIFDSIISQSSTLVSSSVPVNVFNRAETLDNSYLAIFQAEEGARWPGNIKKLQIGFVEVTDPDTNETIEVRQIQDANGDAAFDVLDGQIKPSALTFWTDPLGKDVTPDDPETLEEEEVSGSDGRSVTRGAAAQQIFGFNTNSSCHDVGPGTANDPTSEDAACFRQLYTENPSSANTLIAFDATDAVATALAPDLLDLAAAPTDAEVATAKTIITWARGAIEVDGSLATVTADRWMMGDVLHSKPIPLNYGDSDGIGGSYSRTNPNIRLLFGSNDGWLRMVENTTASGQESGKEVWGFMPNEVLGIQETLARNVAPPSGHPYGVDGEISALIIDKDSDSNIENGDNTAHTVNSTTGEIGIGDKMFIYFGLRRGGNAIYAMDISDPDDKPELMWKITDQTAGFEDLAMTFSTPIPTIVNFDGDPRAVIIFGGGYNGGWNDAETARVGKDIAGLGTDDDKGNAVYVVDAVDGSLIWKAVDSGTAGDTLYVQAGLTDSIASPIAMTDADRNNITDLGYVGDTGGNIWRIDMPELGASDTDGDSRSRWSLTKLAALGGTTLAGDRRFFHEPDIVLARDQVTNADDELEERKYIGVAIISGDRAHPREDDVNNFFYYVKDDITQSGSGVTRSAPIVHSAAASNGLTDITTTCISGQETDCLAADLDRGWKLGLTENGEKGLSTPRVLFGTAFFNTYLPDGDASQGECKIGGLGSGRAWQVSISNGSVPPYIVDDLGEVDEDDRHQDTKQPGIPGDPELISDDGEWQLQFEPGDIDELDEDVKWKVYWYEQGVDDV